MGVGENRELIRPPGKPHLCTYDDSVEAIILYPSLGMPMVLAPGQKKCNLIIATGDDALEKFATDPNDGFALAGAKYVDRHLRLYDMAGAKPLQQEIPGQCLFGYAGVKLHEKAEKHIKVWHLWRFEPGKLVRDRHGKYGAETIEVIGCNGAKKELHVGPRNGRFFGVIAPQFQYAHKWLTQLWEVEIDLDGLKKETKLEITSAPCMSWSWLVKKRATDKENKNYFFAKENLCYEPQDRDIESYLSEQQQGHYEPHYESVAANLVLDNHNLYTPPLPTQKDTQHYLQSWHPAIRMKNDAPLSMGHLTDVHINVRQYALARSKACLLEMEDAKEAAQGDGTLTQPVGERVAHSFSACRELIDQIAENRKGADTALLLTGDYIDFNRNIVPEKVSFGDAVIGEQWKQFNVLANAKDEALYQRGRDDMLMYSLVRRAYLTHRLPVFMTSGNHETYAMPFGISPRAEFGSWAFTLGRYEKNLRYRGDATQQQDIDRQRQRLEEASQWVQGKSCEVIPADHNLTIYEATLAYGPTYGHLWTADNFTAAQFDWFHLLFTPFSDCVLPIGAGPTETDDLPKDAKNVLALLGWGQKERLISLWNLPKDMLGKYLKVGATGFDLRGKGFLPAADGVMTADQLKLLEQGQLYAWAASQAPFVVGSHFPIFSYRPEVPFHYAPTKNQGERSLGSSFPGAFSPYDGVKTRVNSGITIQEHDGNVYLELFNNTFSKLIQQNQEYSAQYNRFNYGGCETGLETYFGKYVNLTPEKNQTGRIDWHFSGHSHRAGIYSLAKAVSGRNGPVHATGYDPSLSSVKLPQGTRFVVGGAGGSFGVQNVNGELSGWTLRPPSALLAKLEKGREKVTPLLSSHKPRLCVSLDYLQCLGWEKSYGIEPPLKWGSYFAKTKMEHFLKFHMEITVSAQIARLKCLDLENMKFWVFQVKKTNNSDDKPAGSWICVRPKVFFYGDKWILSFWEEELKILLSCLEEVSHQDLEAHRARMEECRKQKAEARQRRREDIAANRDSEQTIREIQERQEELEKLEREEKELYYESGGQDVLLRKVPQAFCEIPLKVPEHSPEVWIWCDDMNCKDQWIFPLEIAAACTEKDYELFYEQERDQKKLKVLVEERERLKKSDGLWSGLTRSSEIDRQDFSIGSLKKDIAARQKKIDNMDVHEYVRRPVGERGEVPDWRFLATYFGHKGYVEARKAIIPYENPQGETSGSTDSSSRPSKT